jgi:hypothetical protein
MSPFSVAVQNVPDRELGPLLTRLADAGWTIRPSRLLARMSPLPERRRRRASDPRIFRRTGGWCASATESRIGGRSGTIATRPTACSWHYGRRGALQIGPGETIRNGAWGAIASTSLPSSAAGRHRSRSSSSSQLALGRGRERSDEDAAISAARSCSSSTDLPTASCAAWPPAANRARGRRGWGTATGRHSQPRPCPVG